MKDKYIFFLILIIFSFNLSGQDNCILLLSENKLHGSCENKIFTGFSIELDSVYDQIDSSLIFNLLPRVGTVNIRNKREIPTEF